MKDFRHSGRTAPVKTPRVCRHPDCDCGIQGCGLPTEREAQLRAIAISDAELRATCVQPPFAEQFMEALGEHIDARISYAETRRGASAEYANDDEVVRSGLRLEGLLSKIRISL